LFLFFFCGTEASGKPPVFPYRVAAETSQVYTSVYGRDGERRGRRPGGRGGGGRGEEDELRTTWITRRRPKRRASFVESVSCVAPAGPTTTAPQHNSPCPRPPAREERPEREREREDQKKEKNPFVNDRRRRARFFYNSIPERRRLNKRLFRRYYYVITCVRVHTILCSSSSCVMIIMSRS